MNQVILDKYGDGGNLTKAKLDAAVAEAVSRIRLHMDEFGENAFPAAASDKLVYPVVENRDWTEGFYTGMLWLCYEMTGEDAFRNLAERQLPSFLNRLEKRIVVDHHDMGFLYSLSCVAAYKLTGNEFAKKTAILAADNLMGRFQETGQFFQAWGELGAEDNYRLIIDCLLNLPILYWATEATGDDKYRRAAEGHLKTAMKTVIRPDFSTYHTYYFDTATGEPKYGKTAQGYSDDSAWARGQSWGVYGIALNYAYTKWEELQPSLIGVSDYFLERTGGDNVAYWDLVFNDGSGQPRDSSASAITACGLLCAYEQGLVGEDYLGVAKSIVSSLIDGYSTKDHPESNGLMMHSTYAMPDGGVDECNLYGDYFYLEALVRLSKKWNPYW